MALSKLAQWLAGGRTIVTATGVQPNLATVARPEYKPGHFALQPGYNQGASIGATRDILSGPAWGATAPDAFISLSGLPPAQPVIGQIGGVQSSNAPLGGKCN